MKATWVHETTLTKCGQSPSFAVWRQAAADRMFRRQVCGQSEPLLSAVVHVQALIPLGRLGAVLGTDVVPMRSRCMRDGVKGLELVDEDVFVEPKVGRAWNALHEEARARRSPLAESQAISAAGVDVDAVVVTDPEEVCELALGCGEAGSQGSWR